MADRGLRIAAEDEADLQVLSAALQDAIFRIGDVRYEPRARSFTLLVNRYRWEKSRKRAERVRAALIVSGVLSVRSRNVQLDDPERVGSVLALSFAPEGEPPSGLLQLFLAGGGDIAMPVEALDVKLMDLSAPWAALARPDHERGGR